MIIINNHVIIHKFHLLLSTVLTNSTLQMSHAMQSLQKNMPSRSTLTTFKVSSCSSSTLIHTRNSRNSSSRFPRNISNHSYVRLIKGYNIPMPCNGEHATTDEIMHHSHGTQWQNWLLWYNTPHSGEVHCTILSPSRWHTKGVPTQRSGHNPTVMCLASCCFISVCVQEVLT